MAHTAQKTLSPRIRPTNDRTRCFFEAITSAALGILGIRGLIDGQFHRCFGGRTGKGRLSPDLHVLDGEFRLNPISKPRGWPDVITVFLRSHTENWDGQVIAVIVSGYDGDGADALCGIKDVGGITIAQKPETAGQPDMPEVRSPAGV